MFAAQPDSAIRIVLFLPDRYDLLDPLNRIPARLERGVTVRRCDANDDARLSNGQRADTVDDGDVVDSPTLPNLVTDLRHVKLGGGCICLIFEMRHRSIAGMVSHGPDERGDGPGARVSNQGLRGPGVERLRLNAEPSLAAATHRRNQGKLIAIMKLMVMHHVLLVDHEHGDRSHTFQPRIFMNELREQIPGRGALGHLPPLGGETDDLANDGEVANVNVHGKVTV